MIRNGYAERFAEGAIPGEVRQFLIATLTTLTAHTILAAPTILTTLATRQVRQFQDNARRLAEYEVHILEDKASLAELVASGGGESSAARELKSSLREVAHIASVT